MITYHIPERFLRHVWQHQRFNNANLHASDGRRVEILFPGNLNNDGGPDFCGARIRIGNITFYGDVELHQDAQQWESHLHQADPHYNTVILHVVLTISPLARPARTFSKRFIPLLVLHPYLDDTLRVTWMKAISDERDERRTTIACFNLNHNIPPELLKRWIERLSHQRMEMKIRRFEERLNELIDEQKLVVREPYPRYYGSLDEIPPPTKEHSRRDFANKSLWEQLLFEAIMEGLGYSKNSDSFLLLAQSMRLGFLREYGRGDILTSMALLFGAAGLLPSERSLPDTDSRVYARTLRRRWKELRPSFTGRLSQPGDWLFFRLRPSNFPTARLASMCFLLPSLFGDEGFRTIVRLFKDDVTPGKQIAASLHRVFDFEADEFWRHHYRFEQRPSRKGISLGAARIDDLIVNCCLPIVLLYARVFKDQAIRGQALKTVESMPPLQGNSITRILQQQLLKHRLQWKSAFEQQGGIHLFKFFCAPGRCRACEIGERVGLGSNGAS